uniref:diguanylate cyclase n=2 Tax=Paracidobacterium acidisoli TaxID=2303751 RepID=A0A372IS91_9BACT
MQLTSDTGRNHPAAQNPATLAALLILVIAASWVGLRYTAGFDHIAPLWSTNGLLLAFLLLNPVRRWPGFLAIGFTGFLLSHLITRSALADNFCLSLCDLAEVTLAAWLLTRSGKKITDLTHSPQLLRFALYGVLIGPAAGALLATLILRRPHAVPWRNAFLWLFLPDALGIAAVAPAVLALFGEEPLRLFASGRRRKTLLLLSLLILVSITAFSTGGFFLSFLIFPPLVLVVLELGWAGGVIGIPFIAFAASLMTLHRYRVGPLPYPPLLQRLLVLQAFLAAIIVSVNVVSLVFHERRRHTDLTRENERRFRMLAENARDVIVLTDLDGRRLYVSPAVTPILGWAPRDLVGGSFHTDVIHPDDRPAFQQTLDEVRKFDRGQIIIYRCRKKGGMYVWMEASLSLYRDSLTDEPIGFVKVARDVSRRKAAEEELQNAYETLEAMAIVDALTGVANRRRFDDALDHEWRRAVRSGTSLALLLIDVDHFKSYNDIYGHVRGDACLREIAAAALEVVRRSADIVARFGGEEFAVILPDTEETSAAALGEEIREAVMRREIEHGGNQPGIVTVSIGCTAVVPPRGSKAVTLVEFADEALYQAKHEGRNRVKTRRHSLPSAGHPEETA